jgi:hypothetical protein
MKDYEIQANAEAYAKTKEMNSPRSQDVELDKLMIIEDYTAGVHSCDEEIEAFKTAIEEQRLLIQKLIEDKAVLMSEVNRLRGQWISVDDRLPEEEKNNISISVVAITNRGYWFKGQYDYDNKDWFFSEDPDHLDFEIGEFVTHWMPIPEFNEKCTKTDVDIAGNPWIRTEDCMPEELKDVLVVSNYGDLDEFHVAMYNPSGFWQTSDCMIIEEGVHSWMPIPKLVEK